MYQFRSEFAIFLSVAKVLKKIVLTKLWFPVGGSYWGLDKVKLKLHLTKLFDLKNVTKEILDARLEDGLNPSFIEHFPFVQDSFLQFVAVIFFCADTLLEISVHIAIIWMGAIFATIVASRWANKSIEVVEVWLARYLYIFNYIIIFNGRQINENFVKGIKMYIYVYQIWQKLSIRRNNLFKVFIVYKVVG